jgi:predicted NBD/HSP70 family sugar kinase
VRRIDPRNFHIATRGTSREINRRIALNLIRMHQPISRADLARMMNTRRGAISLLVGELIEDGWVFEGATGETRRGRKPKFLYVDSRHRCVIAVDIRPTRTYAMITDLLGRQLVTVSSFPTDRDPKRFSSDLVKRVRSLLSENADLGACQGIGVVVPGMVEAASGKVLLSANLGWRDVPLRDLLSGGLAIPVHVENSGRACALAQVWATRAEGAVPSDNLVFVSVSDGLGVGVVIAGEVLRGAHNIAGEFGHVPLGLDGPRCGCGATGCLEAYVSNLATLGRYFGRNLHAGKPWPAEAQQLTIEDLIMRARGGDGKAAAAIHATARYLGLGVGSLINAYDPSRVCIGGEIVAGWDFIEATVRGAIAERALTAKAAQTEIAVVPPELYPRLRGAAALVAAPAFAAPAVA